MSTRRVLTATLALAGVGLIGGCSAVASSAQPVAKVGTVQMAAKSTVAPHFIIKPPVVAPLPPPKSPIPPCGVPAPTSAPGYAAMFSGVPATVWGAADTALTVAMPDGRSVWMYSDTATAKPGTTTNVAQNWAKFTHSSAITQNKGCLHISTGNSGGGWILPNDDLQKMYYWIDSAHAISDTEISVLGYEMRQQDDWTTAMTGKFREGIVSLTATGDLNFVRWSGYVPTPPASLLVKDGGAYYGNSVTYNGTVILAEALPQGTTQASYSPELHPELKLASGKTLMTLAMTDFSANPTWANTRPAFYEVTLPVS